MKTKIDYWITKEGLDLIENWARNGYTNENICKQMGISERTFYNYIKKYNVINEKLKSGKEVIDAQVEKAFLKRCLGGKSVEVIEEYDESKNKMVVVKRITKDIQPDAKACIFWLTNRVYDKWKNKQDLEEVLQEMRRQEKINPFANWTEEELRKAAGLDEDDW